MGYQLFTFQSVFQELIEACIFGLEGKLIAKVRSEVSEGHNQISIPFQASRGLYIVHLTNGTEIVTQIIMK